MAKIKPPKGFKLVGPWLRRCGDHYVSRQPQLQLCEWELARVLKFKSALRRVRLGLHAKKPSWKAARIQFKGSHSFDIEWRRPGKRYWEIFTAATRYFLLKHLPEMKDGDTITLWLTVETK